MTEGLEGEVVVLIGAAVLSTLAAAFGASPLGGDRAAASPTSTTRQEARMDITLTVAGGETVAAVLGNGAAARDFASLLPVTLTLKDYASTEKVADLPKRLSIEGEPDGFDPSPGDITFYAPWGNLAIFYKDFGFSRGLVSLGRLSRVPDALKQPGPITVTVERR
jgi:hypothetical protein